ncbi:FecR family protein, partial [Bacteroides fragilis]|nr:FecR family protein [Bacteroides fragilis]
VQLNSGRQSMDSVRLADGTLVMLNAGSRLTYPKEFSGNKREVTLSGQAFLVFYPGWGTSFFVVKNKEWGCYSLGNSI